MNPVVQRIVERAQADDKHIVLPESQDPRVLQAAGEIVAKNYAAVTLLGNPDTIAADAAACGASLEGVTILDHLQSPYHAQFVAKLVEQRSKKGMTEEKAAAMIDQPVYFGAYYVGAGLADGMVAGSICPTADTCRATLFGVGLVEGNRTLSSCSIMNTIIPDVGVHGSLIFADTGVLPEPTVDQLADIGILAAANCRALLDVEPNVAMLSFSTKGSATSPAVEHVIAATKQINERRPDLNVDGELQLDAAIIADIGEKKCPGSPVAGKANTLVFPDLSCGNIAYKLVERLGNATALGPMLMGAAKPINDLSRGCSTEDIVLIAAITACQANM